MANVTMPQLGETVTEGTITRWFKQVGDQVATDEVLFEVSTDKVDSEVPSPAAGYLSEIVVPEGGTVEVGATLAVIADAPPADGQGSPSQPEAASVGADAGGPGDEPPVEPDPSG
ncbi:MAG TPA: biotin/lipoyl-containing protein, partial [Acidimicrobiales bacterium]|nr:biotin/lipoyl-containing protein [Acidimicrobiales bacterium]